APVSPSPEAKSNRSGLSAHPVRALQNPSMPRKISFLNYKGGVGKTSLIVNTAACLARLGKRVLLCDFDTQSNASIWLMRLERWNKLHAEGNGELYSIFEPGKAEVKDLVLHDVVEGKNGEKLLPGLELV